MTAAKMELAAKDSVIISETAALGSKSVRGGL